MALTKMHGAGNDFVILDRLADPALVLDSAQAGLLADRQRGVGCDQILLLEAAEVPAVARYRILNADGSEARQCGNGARCLAAYLHAAHGHAPPFLMQSPVGAVAVDFDCVGQYRVDLGPARGAVQALRLDIAGETVDMLGVSMGNPHAVLRVDTLDDGHFERLAPALATHPAFAEGCNIEFVCALPPGGAADFAVRVWERGVGETLACGSGACAVLVALRHAGVAASGLRLQLPGGVLTVEITEPGATLRLSGPVARVFHGWWLPPSAP
ncbi:MAG: diaminopimelate epimerase [Xanthomonadales bacterium]|jgi:diaminopimelate epimerase|nr:diaminopimelate epimerase [Xanthomonadales bacterium]